MSHPCRKFAPLALLSVGALMTTPAAQAASIDHAPVGCVMSEQFPRFEARIDPADAVGRARILFRPDGSSHWYAVTMARSQDGFAAALPRPKKTLKRFHYYLEVADESLATSRTEEYTTEVATVVGGCGTAATAASVPTASILLEAPTGAPAVPAGFSSAGVVAAKAGMVAGAAAAAGGAASGAGVATGGGVGTTTLIVAGVGVVAAGAAVAVATGAVGEDLGPPAEVRGQVFGNFGPNPANRTGPGIFSPPIADAIVSSSLDSATAVTDGGGNFHLVTRTSLENSGIGFTLTITAPGYPTYRLCAGWAGRSDPYTFALSIGTPTLEMIGGPGC